MGGFNDTEFLYRMIHDLQGVMSNVTVMIAQIQTGMEKNTEEFERLRDNIEMYITKINDIPLENKKAIQDLVEEFNVLKTRVGDAVKAIEDESEEITIFKTKTNEALDQITKKLEEVSESTETITKEIEKGSKVKNKVWGATWTVLKPILIAIGILLVAYAFNLFIEFLKFIQQHIPLLKIGG